METEAQEWKEVFAERLADALSSKGLKQNDLAERIGVTEAAVSRWVSEQGGAGWRRLAEICKTIPVSADYLLGLTPVASAPGANIVTITSANSGMEDLASLLRTETVEVAGYTFLPVPILARPEHVALTEVDIGNIEGVALVRTRRLAPLLRGRFVPGRIVGLELAGRWATECEQLMGPPFVTGGTLVLDRGGPGWNLDSVQEGTVFLVRVKTHFSVRRVWWDGEHLLLAGDHSSTHPIIVHAPAQENLSEVLVAQVLEIIGPVR